MHGRSRMTIDPHPYCAGTEHVRLSPTRQTSPTKQTQGTVGRGGGGGLQWLGVTRRASISPLFLRGLSFVLDVVKINGINSPVEWQSTQFENNCLITKCVLSVRYRATRARGGSGPRGSNHSANAMAIFALHKENRSCNNKLFFVREVMSHSR